jgi:hypothetical protein
MRTPLFNISFISALMLLSHFATSQMTISMPVERSVFQRVNNKATIQIGGSTSTFISQLQVKFSVLNGGNPIDWTTVNTNIFGEFRCQLSDVAAGWYKLEIRGLTNGAQVAYDEVEKVGVGEVFIVSGQSNAQGGRNNEAFATQIYYGAQDDRVNCIDFSTDDPNYTYPIPNISKIAAETDIAPKGKASWCWALLGDMIAQEWNVPVIFFNAAVGATTAQTWSNSANNNTEPYINLKKTFDYYAKIYGARALLWHQGESDIFNFSVNMPQSCINYSNNLNNIINKSKADFNPNLSWVISKVSMIAGYTDGNLVNCQEACALLPNSNRFLGPYTDLIQPLASDRDEFVHFRGTGFILLAEAWFNSINTPNFINNSTPISPTVNLKVENNQFVFGNSLPPCIGANQTVKSGNWNDPTVWSCGVVPITLNEIIINEGHNITISNSNIYLKNIAVNGTLSFENGGSIVACDY